MDATAALAPDKLRKDAVRLGVLLLVAGLLTAFAPSGLRVIATVLAGLGALLCLGSSVIALTTLGYARRAAVRGLLVYGGGLLAFGAVAVWAILSL